MSETLQERLRADLNTARRDRDRLRTTVLSMTLSEAKNRQIELGRELTDEDIVEVVTRAVKRRLSKARAVTRSRKKRRIRWSSVSSRPGSVSASCCSWP